MDPIAIFEEKVDTFCSYSKLSRSDPFVWREILSHGLLSAYMPAEFVWKYRYQAWDWPVLVKQYAHGGFMFMLRNKNMSYKELLNLYNSNQNVI